MGGKVLGGRRRETLVSRMDRGLLIEGRGEERNRKVRLKGPEGRKKAETVMTGPSLNFRVGKKMKKGRGGQKAA